ncbi:long-chain fatty acid--CoA ligase [bacterium]|nr:MAG: long-chain fatty acid--CoA ligase [bacterium]
MSSGSDGEVPSPYESRPWLARYPSWVPHGLRPSSPSALDMFAASLRRAPDAPAIHYREQSVSFKELDRASAALGTALAVRGVARGDRVAVYLQNIPEFVLSALAVWRLGAVLVPLSPMLKEREVRHQLTDSGARALVALDGIYEENARPALAGTDLRTVITVRGPDEALGSNPGGAAGTGGEPAPEDFHRLLGEFDGATLPDPGLRPEDIAVLTYTSGTTGRPKGAMNTHGNVVFNAEFYRTWLRLGPGDVMLGAAPLFHITGLVAHMAVCLSAGIPLVLFYRFEPGEALRLIERWRCTATVASITAFLGMMARPEIGTRDLSRFRKVYSGGAPVAPATVRRFQELTGAYIHNIYGLTETTSPSHAIPLGTSAPVDPDSGALSVGVPIPDTVVKVVDPETMVEVRPGEIGELWTKGPGVVPGYWRNPDATAQGFTQGYLHTGDIGKMDADGWFFIIDRAKDMINASGYKVWPREVEDGLYQHPAVNEASVVGIPDPYRGETVKAYVSLKPGHQATPEELVDFCRARMAAYKYPRTVEIVDEIPKNASGKFLRRVLRERDLNRSPEA